MFIPASLKPYFLISLVLVVASCSTPPPPVTTTPIKIEPEAQPKLQKRISIADTKELLQSVPLDIDSLILHAEHYIGAQQYQEAQALLVAIAPYLPETLHERAKTLILLASPQQQNELADMSQWLTTPLANPQLDETRTDLLITSLSQQAKHIEAMAMVAVRATSKADKHEQIFNTLSRYQNRELQQIAAEHKVLAPHVALIQIIRSEASNREAFSSAIEQYKQVYLAHPLAQSLPSVLNQVTQESVIQKQNVLVMLPLSGRFGSTGNAIKQGILAAYFKAATDTEATITFADTASQSDQELIELMQQADWIIGPLLKESIDRLLPNMPFTVGKTLLNRPDFAQLQELRAQTWFDKLTFFGLSPEDEAIQLADHVTANGYKKPIIVASNLGVSSRMLDAFMARWQNIQKAKKNDSRADIVRFDNIDALDESLSTALGVAQSEENASQIDRLTNRILYDQTRSRQDVDAIIVFASPEEMALVNPMVEASISPLRQQVVPVFATSRSIELDTAKNTLRDLENVHFLDSPFILQADKWRALSDTVNQNWPNQTSRFSRLFAFGFDAYAMLAQMPLLSQLPGYQYSGMSGLLQIDEYRQIRRHLPIAQVNQQTVSLLEE